MSSTPLFRQSQESIAERIRALRQARGLSQEDLALQAGIDRTYQSQIERAIGNPSLRVLCALAEALDVCLRDLLTGDDKAA